MLSFTLPSFAKIILSYDAYPSWAINVKMSISSSSFANTLYPYVGSDDVVFLLILEGIHFVEVYTAMSLIISMALRFVPRLKAQTKVVANAQRTMGRDVSNGSIIKRAKHGLNIISIMTTWSLENAIETADSMKSRGYGIPGRTAFSIFTFDKRDKKAFFTILILGIYTVCGSLAGGMYFRYFPSVKGVVPTLFSISVFLAYLFLCISPILIEIWEVRRWKASRSNI